eukprot:9669403-Ditylum_brightwellii.AAC.1
MSPDHQLPLSSLPTSSNSNVPLTMHPLSNPPLSIGLPIHPPNGAHQQHMCQNHTAREGMNLGKKRGGRSSAK